MSRTLLQIVGDAIGEKVSRLHVVTPTRSIYIDSPGHDVEPADGREVLLRAQVRVPARRLAKPRRRRRS